MEKFIKYKRIAKKVNESELNKLFDELITEGWEIIHYKEKGSHVMFDVVIIVGKKQSNVL
jgi:hypothetical protein